MFRNGDTLFAKITPCTENGKIALVQGLRGEVGLGSTEFIVLSPQAEVTPEFLYFQLIRDDIRALCSSLMEGSTGRQRVPTSIFRKRIKIPVPPCLDEQRAVANALLLFDKHITATQLAIAAAERLQRGLMRELLAGRIRPDGSARAAGEFADDGRGPLPQTWSWARVKEFGEVTTGKTPPTESAAHFLGDIPFITPGDMGRAKWIQAVERTLALSGAKLAGELPARTVCVVCIGATIGKVGITTRPSATNQQINSVLCSDQHSSEYLYYALRHRAQHILAIAGVNATPQLNKSEFSKYRLPMPANRDEEDAIAAQLSTFDDLIRAKETKITALQRLKKSLMQNLLTGRMRLTPETIATLNGATTL